MENTKEINVSTTSKEDVQNLNSQPKFVFLIKNAYAKFASIDAETGVKKTPMIIFKVNDLQKVFVTLKEGSFIGVGKTEAEEKQFSIQSEDIESIVGYTQSIKPTSPNSKFKPSAIKEELNTFDLANFKQNVITTSAKKFFESLKSNKNNHQVSSDEVVEDESTSDNLANALKDVSPEDLKTSKFKEVKSTNEKEVQKNN